MKTSGAIRDARISRDFGGIEVRSSYIPFYIAAIIGFASMVCQVMYLFYPSPQWSVWAVLLPIFAGIFMMIASVMMPRS